ncbi:MAG: helix-hairpin-helix domain-containing protein [Candidatus Bathyarchaeota archaeon]|jgi:predicted flap endonuclease-1-like 5' DNA nuclease|nr:helix-hairpin-helix domain-containing protein [Candidatus Bathyarchaeota archaeon]
MRSDYALYTVAIIFFIITAIVLVYQVEFKELWVVTTAVLGLLFIGLGYSQRAKPQVRAAEPTPTPAPQLTVTEVVVEEKPVTPAEVTPPTLELTQVKGIKEKRAGQLKAVGINSVEDLATASAKDLAAKLKISPKIVERWIDDAQKLVKKS